MKSANSENVFRHESVVVTGIGVVSPIGIGKKEFFESLESGRRGFRPIDLFPTHGFTGRYYAPVDLETLPPDTFPPRAKNWDRHVRLAYLAVVEALADAAVSARDSGMGLIAATCSGGMLSIERHYRIRAGLEAGIYDEAFFRAERYFGMEWELGEVLGIGGYTTTVVTACAASANAIGLACDLLLAGITDRMIVVGADAFAPSTFSGFDCLKTTTPETCAPFSYPMGLNLGEGACAWIIERSADAHRRGAGIYACLCGYGLSCDAYHPTSPDPTAKGAVLALKRALRCAGEKPDAIDYINAHGTGTPANDKVESKAVTRVFGSHPPPVSSTKSYFGHTLGAAGILETTASILMLRKNMLPPTLHFSGPREACRLDYIPNTPRKTSARRFISNSFAFAGNNCVLVVDIAGDDRHREPRGETAPKREDVVISGYGAVIPEAGSGTHAHRVSAAVRYAKRISGEHRGIQYVKCDTGRLKREERRRVEPGFDDASVLSLAATRQALERAGLQINRKKGRDVGLILGLSFGPGTGERMHLESIMQNGLHQPSLRGFPFIVLNSVQGNVSRALHLRGFSSTLCSTAGAGLDAFLYGFEAIRLGHSDVLVAGGTDEVNMHLLEDISLVHEAGASFIPDSGPVIEGSVMAVLEARKNAAGRAASILGTLLSIGAAWARGGENAGKDLSRMMSRLVAEGLERAGIAAGDVTRLSRNPSEKWLEEILPASMRQVSGSRLNSSSDDELPGTAFASGPVLRLLLDLERCAPGDVLLHISSSCWKKIYVVLARREGT